MQYFTKNLFKKMCTLEKLLWELSLVNILNYTMKSLPVYKGLLLSSECNSLILSVFESNYLKSKASEIPYKANKLYNIQFSVTDANLKLVVD